MSLFGDDDDEDDDDPNTKNTQPLSPLPLSLYNLPLHMKNICLEVVEYSSIFGNYTRHPAGGNLEIRKEFENKEESVIAFQHCHIKHSLDYWIFKLDNE